MVKGNLYLYLTYLYQSLETVPLDCIFPDSSGKGILGAAFKKVTFQSYDDLIGTNFKETFTLFS